MIVQPGKITNQIDLLGSPQNSLYLLHGREAMIIGGGMSWVVPELERQLANLPVDPGRIRYLLIQHSHFDHCGAVPYLHRKFPRMEILASSYAQRVFANPKVMGFLVAENERLASARGVAEEVRRLAGQMGEIRVDRVVGEGDRVDLGEGLDVRFLDVPGHSQCAVAVYVPAIRTLFPTDATPFPLEDGEILSFPAPQYDFALYKESLRKLAALEVEICAFEHHGVFIGADAEKVLARGRELTEALEKDLLAHSGSPRELELWIAQATADHLKRPNSWLTPELLQRVVATIARKVLAAHKPTSPAD